MVWTYIISKLIGSSILFLSYLNKNIGNLVLDINSSENLKIFVHMFTNIRSTGSCETYFSDDV